MRGLVLRSGRTDCLMCFSKDIFSRTGDAAAAEQPAGVVTLTARRGRQKLHVSGLLGNVELELCGFFYCLMLTRAGGICAGGTA